MGKKNILLTGANGDFGKFLVKKISKYHNIKILTRKYVKFVPLQNQFLFKDFTKIISAQNIFKNIDIIIHLAGEKKFDKSKNNYNQLIKSNILITKYLINCSIKYKVKKFIFLSSIKVNFLDRAIKLKDMKYGNNPYAISKKIAE
ncbi:NAD-dependent epimerase/dehydratase family protein, partial [Pelagibacteraceae bacterium]|nr:NAD-dependent epimerase/dehydratase family protein [Pelagibacteraceae bacterium]